MRVFHLTSRVISLGARFAQGLERVLLPMSCVFCGARFDLRQAPVCDDCFVDLPWIDNACARCANSVTTRLPDGVFCGDCQADPPPFYSAVAPLQYTFPVDAAIKAMKYRRRQFYLPALAHLLREASQQLPADIDAVVPVPLHWRRHATRGFNQSTELARLIATRIGLNVLGNVKRCRATPFQSGLSAAQRRRNLKAAFSVKGDLHAKHPLIVDDVITTTATCCQLTNVLLAAGAKKVSVIAVARASPD